jgi:hypothetical protein
MGKLMADSEFYVCDYCNKGTGLWEKYHRFSFLDHKFLNWDGRMWAIEDALLSMTVEGFWKEIHPLSDMSEVELPSSYYFCWTFLSSL